MVGKIFTLFIITFMVGGTLFRVLYSYCKSDIKNTKIKFFSCLGFYLITFEFTYDNKIQGFLFYEMSIGLFYPIYSVIKTNYIDNNNRGSFYGSSSVEVVLFLYFNFYFCLSINLFLYWKNLIYNDEEKIIHLKRINHFLMNFLKEKVKLMIIMIYIINDILVIMK